MLATLSKTDKEIAKIQDTACLTKTLNGSDSGSHSHETPFFFNPSLVYKMACRTCNLNWSTIFNKVQQIRKGRLAEASFEIISYWYYLPQTTPNTLCPNLAESSKSKVEQTPTPKMPSSHPQSVSKTPRQMASVVAQYIVSFSILVVTLLVLLTMICLVVEYFPWFLAAGFFVMIVTIPELQQGMSAAAERMKKEHESKSIQTPEPAIAKHDTHVTDKRQIKMSLRSGRLV